MLGSTVTIQRTGNIGMTDLFLLVKLAYMYTLWSCDYQFMLLVCVGFDYQSILIGASLSEPNIDSTTVLDFVCIYMYGTTVTSAACLAASVYRLPRVRFCTWPKLSFSDQQFCSAA